jgi:DnaJ family protein C protein 8
VLLDDKLRAELDENIADARMLLMREKKLTADDEETRGEEFAKEWREKVVWVIRDNEMRKARQMKAQLREEGRQQRKDDEEAAERKRKREHDDAWDKTREQRIDSWHNFTQGKKADPEVGQKKKKKKMKALG